MAFSASISTNFSKGRTSSSNTFFSTNSYVVKMFEVFIKPIPKKRWHEYVLQDASEFIDDKTVAPQTVFDNYGYFVLVDAVNGGRADYSISDKVKAGTSFQDFSMAAKASYDGLFASGSVSASGGNSSSSAFSFSNKEEKLETFGGNPLTINELKTPYLYARKTWANSVKEKPTLIGFGGAAAQPLIPIWYLCKDPARAKQLEDEFNRIAPTKAIKAAQKQYIKDIKIMYGDDYTQMLHRVPKYYTGIMRVDQSLNYRVKRGRPAQLYLLYETTTNRDEAITDMFYKTIAYYGNNPDYNMDTERGQEYYSTPMKAANHSQQVGTYNVIKGYENALRDRVLNLNLGFERASDKKRKDWEVGDFITLWYTKDPVASPIMAIDVVPREVGWDDPEYEGWEPITELNSPYPGSTNWCNQPDKKGQNGFVTIIIKRETND